jgi:type I restriction enzyme S subunit
MKAERLLAQYERIADAPEAVARLRRFILDLAVRGKLVPQDPKDEPASELLKRSTAEKARRVKAGEIRSSKVSEPIRDDELPITLPRGWAWSRLCDIGKLSGGMTPSMNRPDFWDGDIVWLSPKDIKADEVANSELKISAIGLSETRLEQYPPGCLFMVARSGILKRTFPVAINRVPAAANQDMKVLAPFCEEQERFLQIMFRGLTDFLLSTLVKTGTTVQSLKYAEFEQQPFPLPPLAEQKRIVAKVDELMALCDQLGKARAEREATRDRLAAASLARLNDPDPETFQDDARFALDALPALTARPDQVKQLRQTILNLAVRGKLVSQDPKDEPASELLKRLSKAQIVACTREGLRSRPPIAKLSRADMWFDFPESWVLSSFDDLFVIVSGVTKGQKVAASEAVDVPYLRVANVQRGHLDLSVIKKITVRKADEERYSLRTGDVLMTEGGDWDKLGRAAIWHEEIPGCIHQNHVFRVRPPSGDISSKWIITYANSLLGRAFFEDASKQTTNLASINMTQLRGCPIPLPPVAEQHRIVAKVDELMSLCDRLEDGLTWGGEVRCRLLDALLHEALEPASGALQAKVHRETA